MAKPAGTAKPIGAARADTALPVRLDRVSGVPLAVQLADALRDAAANGHLRGGDRLPSTRALASRLGVSRTVTSAAYEQLHAEGWIAGRHGSGTYVTTSPPAGRPERRAVVEPEDSTPDLLELTLGQPWAEGLDRAAWRRAWRAAADAPPLSTAQRAGLPEYRAVVAEHLLRHRGLDTGADSVLATGGTTAAVVELANAMLRHGDLVAVEEPGYQRAVHAFRSAGVRVAPVAVDGEGLRPDALPPGVRAVYCSPAHQYPMGGRMSAARRVELVERARAGRFLLVEDDYDGELRFDVAPLPLLAALAPDVVAHLGTTSKILTPTLGAGWMVAPPAVTSVVLEYRDRTGTRPAPAGQRVLVELARHGDLGRHLRKLRRELSERRTMLTSALRAARIPVLGDDAGAHLVVPLPSAGAERELVAAGRERGILLDGLCRHFAGEPTAHGIAIGYSGCGRKALRDALDVLVELLGGAGAGTPLGAGGGSGPSAR
ncbi:GntR family transcriptional regulator / MocR family aminotransferase [Amycolatopsis arida]|uniref:GntR family transcriptional regulator / MocR family aminotransferase n=1 Tax=Amycolatopsis arida TaxID=587909 RepID=A0A1I5NS10_9PSEU|nr:PLP-dependent aminotransferase family protein [Amycolatopsis arida]TDX98225.1 GntR family transcriptional regulator/MocR family aminotransferase [Amycolatopsis arida]SFP24628.1 GntR family transcriptional regulator / MocR family aminotransferase [Amycolatopsis arida]